MEENSKKMFDQNYGKMVELAQRFISQERFIRVNSDTNTFLCIKSKKAYNLANILTKRGFNVKVKSVCEGLIYEILYDFATIFTFYKIEKEIYDLIIFKKGGAAKQKHSRKRDKEIIPANPIPVQIPVLSLRNQLIIIYQDLYNPMKIADYTENNQLKDIVIRNLELKLEKKIVSGKIKSYAAKSKFTPPVFKDEIFVGKIAVEFVLGEEYEFPGPIEIISANVEATLDFIAKHYKIDSAETVDFKVLTDYALKITTVMINKKPEIIIYNSATYELIPFFTPRKDFNIASIYVICRFILINIFRAKLMSNADENIITMLQLQHYMVIKTDTYTLPIDDKITSVNQISQRYYGQYIEPKILYSELCPNGRFYTPFEMLARGLKLINF